MYTQHEYFPHAHAPYSVVETHVKFADDLGNEHAAHDYQKEAVLLLHAKRSSILKFQKKIVLC
jgi:hypothetical protein